jgi:hypothetical protein
MSRDDNVTEAIIEGGKDGYRLGKSIARVLMVLVRPIVLSTQALFRKDMGERFLTLNQTVLTGAVIVAAAAATFLGGYQSAHTLAARQEADATAACAVIFGVLWLGGFVAAAVWHFQVTLRKRGRDTILWHSRSNGVPRVPQITFPMELAIVWGLTVLAYWFGLFGFGFLLMLSGLFAWQSDVCHKKEFYNRVLDQIDGQIESEWLGEAVEKRLSPAQAHGVDTWMPAHISDDYRRKVAGFLKGR